jgi:hypothetical protein
VTATTDFRNGRSAARARFDPLFRDRGGSRRVRSSKKRLLMFTLNSRVRRFDPCTFAALAFTLPFFGQTVALMLSRNAGIAVAVRPLHIGARGREVIWAMALSAIRPLAPCALESILAAVQHADPHVGA